jgi:lysyl-tRNA synthetase class 2
MEVPMLLVAADAVGVGWMGETRAAMAGFLIGLLATFLFVRINTRLIRAKVSWWFHDIESEGGTHVHHMVIGVILMVTVGIVLIALSPEELLAQVLALLFGVGVALTLDEFALILNLQDVYWRKEGRLSVDAVIIVVCVAALFVLGLNPFGDLGKPGLDGDIFRMALALWFVVVIIPVVLCLLKGKIWTGVVGLFVPLVAIVGAIRLARPKSPWAKRRYAKKPKKLARAQHREVRLDARWIAWRDAFFDLIAGKPHLPSLPPLGPSGAPAAAPETAGEGDQTETPAGT